MATTKLLLTTGDQIEAEGSLTEVIKELENAARSSVGTFARLTEADTGEPLALNANQVVVVRSGED